MQMVGDLLPSLRGQAGWAQGSPVLPPWRCSLCCREVTWTCLGWIFSGSIIYKTFSEPQLPCL